MNINEIPPNAMVGISENDEFIVINDNKYCICRFKMYVETQPVTYFISDSNKSFLSGPIDTSKTVKSTTEYDKNIYVLIDICTTEYDSLDNARNDIKNGNMHWLNDVLRPFHYFENIIKY